MIIIAGAGIGGLTLGCALSRSRRRFRIFERAPKLRAVGAGIALSANAFQALAHVGLAKQVRACGCELAVADIRNTAGRVLISMRVRDLAPGGTVAMTRTGLQQTLLAALGATVETGRAVAGYNSTPGGVRVRLADGEELDAELLIGADGLHSAVRQAMRGDEPLRYSGQTSWRGLVADVDLSEPDRVTESWGPGRRFGIVPVGLRQVYWFAVANAPARERDGADPRGELRERFAGWHAPIDELLLIGRRAGHGVGSDAHAGLTGIGLSAGVPVVARRTVRLCGVRAGPCLCVARPGVVALIARAARYGASTHTGPALACIHLGARVPVVAVGAVVPNCTLPEGKWDDDRVGREVLELHGTLCRERADLVFRDAARGAQGHVGVRVAVVVGVLVSIQIDTGALRRRQSGDVCLHGHGDRTAELQPIGFQVINRERQPHVRARANAQVHGRIGRR